LQLRRWREAAGLGGALAAPALGRAARLWQHWRLQLMAASALGLIGLLLISLVPPARPPIPKAREPRRVSLPSPPPSLVTLELTGVPEDATVTLDDQVAQPTVTVPRDGRPRSIAVVAPGKLPWQMNYVPDADQRLAVDLRDDIPASAPAPSKLKKVSRKKLASKSPGALRVPDF
jgi:hypothetical protein